MVKKMACKFSIWSGKCDLWNDNGVVFEHIVNSCNSEGCCFVEDDEDPSMSCEDYEER